VAPDLFRVAMPGSRTDLVVGFLDAEGSGRPRFLFAGGRAHVRAEA
jgi:hypothetical protein